MRLKLWYQECTLKDSINHIEGPGEIVSYHAFLFVSPAHLRTQERNVWATGLARLYHVLIYDIQTLKSFYFSNKLK